MSLICQPIFDSTRVGLDPLQTAGAHQSGKSCRDDVTGGADPLAEVIEATGPEQRFSHDDHRPTIPDH